VFGHSGSQAPQLMHSLVIIVAMQGPTPMDSEFRLEPVLVSLSYLTTYAKTGNDPIPGNE